MRRRWTKGKVWMYHDQERDLLVIVTRCEVDKRRVGGVATDYLRSASGFAIMGETVKRFYVRLKEWKKGPFFLIFGHRYYLSECVELHPKSLANMTFIPILRWEDYFLTQGYEVRSLRDFEYAERLVRFKSYSSDQECLIALNRSLRQYQVRGYDGVLLNALGDVKITLYVWALAPLHGLSVCVAPFKKAYGQYQLVGRVEPIMSFDRIIGMAMDGLMAQTAEDIQDQYHRKEVFLTGFGDIQNRISPATKTTIYQEGV